MFTAFRIVLSFLILSILSCSTSSDKANAPTASSGDSKAASQSEVPTANSEEAKKKVILFGDSITAGYGLEEKEAYPHRLQMMIDDADLSYQIVNAGISGETTAAGLSRINWILKQPVDVFVLELGGNDALRGVDPEETYRNLSGICAAVQAKYPQAKILLTGMEAPPNLGEKYTSAFRKVYQRVAKEKQVALMPFLLESVGGVPELNQKDRIHPTAKGHAIVAKNVWKYLLPLLQQ